jgi:DNA-directed RNA polymerase specialized sigma54-like protein
LSAKRTYIAYIKINAAIFMLIIVNNFKRNIGFIFYEFKYFFSSQLSSEKGGAISSTAVQALIKQIVEGESSAKPISDTHIAKLLNDQGYVIARRTVAKYRESLRIPAVHLRKE